ncbi:hypothetical protein IWZ03DRAFT_363676 [Phyllosticta citriasiana]|uniref:Uncharacterized protein n=1 Tax=Phyllosticta citriasiana TaxID=595635 RepID=A0ABR1KAF1_9PEZI
MECNSANRTLGDDVGNIQRLLGLYLYAVKRAALLKGPKKELSADLAPNISSLAAAEPRLRWLLLHWQSLREGVEWVRYHSALVPPACLALPAPARLSGSPRYSEGKPKRACLAPLSCSRLLLRAESGACLLDCVHMSMFGYMHSLCESTWTHGASKRHATPQPRVVEAIRKGALHHLPSKLRLSLMVDRGVVWGQSTNKEIGATEDGLAENNSSGQGNFNVSSAAASLQPEHVFVDTENQPCTRLVSHIQVPGIIVPAIHTDDTCFASQGRFERSVGRSTHRGG